MPATSTDDDLIELIQAQLEGLRKTPDGLFLYRMIDRGLQNRGGEYTGDTGRDFVSFLHTLLQKYAVNSDGDTVTRIKVRLLQQRLAPHLAQNDNQTKDKAQPPLMRGSSMQDPEEVLIEALPAEQDVPDYEDTKSVAPAQAAPVATPREEPVAQVAPPRPDPEPDALPPESLIIEGLELDESAFEKELAERVALEESEKRQSMEAEAEDSEGAEAADSEIKDSKDKSLLEQEARDAKAEAIKASLKPLTSTKDETKSSKKSSAFNRDRNEYDVSVDDSLSIDEPLPTKEPDAVEQDSAVQRKSIAEIIPSDVKEELARGAPKAAKKKASPPLSLDPDFNNPNPAVGSTEPDIVVGSESGPKEPAVTRGKKKLVRSRPADSTEAVKNTSRDRVDRLHETFANKLAENITRSRGYHKLLKSNLKTLKLADSPDDILDIKHLLIMGLEDLLKGNEAISKNLGATNHYLKISQLDRHLLKDELGRVRDQSMVDELTGLQNKVAFVKQIEAEVGRSKRYGFSLALSIIVLDQFDSYTARFGKDAGDEIIRTLANQVLAGFRGYDAVARLSKDKFGVLLPNTQKEGAMSAIEKAQKIAANTVIQVKGKSLRLPTFTSSLALYSPGDKPDALMKRAYDALDLVNKDTRNKIIVALAQT